MDILSKPGIRSVTIFLLVLLLYRPAIADGFIDSRSVTVEAGYDSDSAKTWYIDTQLGLSSGYWIYLAAQKNNDHQGGKNPPVIIIHGNQTKSVPQTYKRYLVHAFRRAMKLTGTPVRIEFRSGSNPYEGRKNKLTGRQIKRKSRLMRHVKKK